MTHSVLNTLLSFVFMGLVCLIGRRLAGRDIGGLAELKWVAEYADLHGVMMAPHGIADGLLGTAALVQVCATLPDNYIAFELPAVRPGWWADRPTGWPGVG